MEERIKMDRRYDWVGPPDKVSKIRSIKLRRDEKEIPMETSYRNSREELNKWNSNFWAHHNRLFDSRKAAFIEQRKKELGKFEVVSANDLSVFYRNFLNERHEAMSNYNKEWYKRNLSLIYPALKVNLVRFKRLLLRR